MKKFLTLTFILMQGVSFAASDFLPQSFSAQFEQEYVSTLKSRVKKGNGKVDYQFPGKIRFETNTPSTVIYVSNAIKAWYYRAPFVPEEQGEVTITSAANGATPFTKFFDVLKNGLKSNSQYIVERKENVSTLKFLKDASAEYGISEASIVFKDKGEAFKDIDYIELTFNDKKTSKLKFKDLKINNVNAAETFEFVIPANTKTVN